MATHALDDRLIPVHYTIYGRQVAALDKLAKRLNVTKSELVRDGVDLVLERYHLKEPRDQEER